MAVVLTSFGYRVFIRLLYIENARLSASDDLEVKGTVDTAKSAYEQGVVSKSYHIETP